MAQALMLGRSTPDRDALLARTAAHGGDIDASRMPQLPRDREGVGAALEDSRAALESGGVFPPSLLETRRRVLVPQP
jgi:hypothetical protein